MQSDTFIFRTVILLGIGLSIGLMIKAGRNPPPLPQTPREAQQKVDEPIVAEKISIIEEDFTKEELAIITKAAKRNDCNGELFLVLLAIRKAENGRPGLEFGVMHPRAKNTDLDTQAGWAAATVRKNYDRWKRAGSPGDFIVFLGNRYCPVGADNDPSNLNQHWVKNVKYWVKKLGNMKENKNVN